MSATTSEMWLTGWSLLAVTNTIAVISATIQTKTTAGCMQIEWSVCFVTSNKTIGNFLITAKIAALSIKESSVNKEEVKFLIYYRLDCVV